MENFKLHSYGKNLDWFHFRRNLNSAMESFSITYCHDGTICMTGDYGCLCWQREFFPKNPQYGFPDKNTFIGYFSEKVKRAEFNQNIRTWKKDLAITDIKESIKYDQEEGYIDNAKALNNILEKFDDIENDEGEYGHIQMMEIFNNHFDLEDYKDFGCCYTDSFQQKFEMLKYVSEQILEIVNKNK